jgi:hypothetical protein
MREIWKDVVGYEGFYQVSNFGNVRSIRFEKIKTIYPYKKSTGYFHVNLCVCRKSKMFLVHRLVAMAFIENKHNYEFINHKDENKSNNQVSNLEWCTASYNNNYGTRNEKRNKKLCKKVVQFKNGIEINRFDSVNQAAEKLGYSKSHISNIINENIKNTHDFDLKFLNEVYNVE